MRSPRRTTGPRALAAVDLLFALTTVVLLLAMVMPALGRLRGLSMTDQSLANLAALSFAHNVYAWDWNGRQFTQVIDDLSDFGDDISAVTAFNAVSEQDHPPILLGWGAPNDTFGLYAYWMNFAGNHSLVQPIEFESESGFGWFRIPNSKGLHDYVAGRMFSPEFFAPSDTVPFGLAETAFDDPFEFQALIGNSDLVWSSYCLSAAALFDPIVFSPPVSPIGNGWQDPFLVPDGFRCPNLDAATYPDLKTHMLEHHWLQGPPADCNPIVEDGTFEGCEPFYFNGGIASAPATLFYDGHVRLLPNQEVQVWDQLEIDLFDFGLWSRDTPFGSDGYFGDLVFDGAVDVSHHVLTTDGILGRDTLGPLTSTLPNSSRAALRRHRVPGPESLGDPAGPTVSMPVHDFLFEEGSP